MLQLPWRMQDPKTPAPPSALRPTEPPSVAAPGRLATAMAAAGSGAAGVMSGRPAKAAGGLPALEVPDHVRFSAHVHSECQRVPALPSPLRQ